MLPAIDRTTLFEPYGMSGKRAASWPEMSTIDAALDGLSSHRGERVPARSSPARTSRRALLEHGADYYHRREVQDEHG